MHKQIINRPVALEQCQFSAGISPLMARIYSARGIFNNDALNKQLTNLLDYHLLKDIDTAARLLANGIMQKQRILIVGDFDCDGATSSTLGVLALRAMGAQVDYLVPNRFEYGYGLTPAIVHVTHNYQPDILVTVDNGISSIDGVRAAKARGLKVIITDHHLAGQALPEADAIVNPNQPECLFPAKNTAGVGIIFYVMCALRAELKTRGWFDNRPLPNMAHYLDLVALGTVADVVSLDQNNRILVFQGLARIRAGHCRPGIKALVDIARRDITRLNASDLGFALGPRLNAAGRLDDMSIGIELLLTESANQARTLAAELDSLNEERKAIEASMQREAISALESLEFNHHQSLPWGLCLYKDDWHQGVIGILAARIKDRLNRPVIAFAEGDNEELKGSARSIPGLHMRDALDSIATENPGLISKFGGHAMAAGLSLKAPDLPRFETAFDNKVRELIDEADLNAKIPTDGTLSAEQITLETALCIREGEPWGQHFPEPVFQGQFQITQQKLVGQKHLKMVLQVPNEQTWIDAIAFNIDTAQWPNPSVTTIEAVYKLDINEFQGQQNLQLMVDYLHPVTG
ncbi:single-stranded-DNA-specific exonuclease RecJ [Candidatus Sororendozoicomonas aggregata]|uniref:single-stranded-DNA-specific exonuclease RecJ n=1 Tax=Candidatus Sororendozoicomonas aggregata TaxID=3073239 RepID=UPI002ED30908